MFPESLTTLAGAVIDAGRNQNLRLATAESCTGGLIAGCLTAVSGSSDVLRHGFVTYANEAKVDLLGVQEKLLIDNGAVSEPVSRAMAEGAIASGSADIAVSVTGIAGPGGGSDEKPVGLVHISAARTGFDTLHERHVFDGDRNDVRMRTVEAALRLLLKRLED